ncbi:MAG: peptidase M20, partial [Thermomicrobiaceae bacterium]|nr:peptidase M20 [Thermomicrobiaceae bacterium]
TDPQALARLADQVERIILSRRSDRVRVAIDVLGERPAGATPESARIVREAVAILGRLGIQAELNASSTDANIPIARGIPAICVGLTFGANAHRTDETIEIAPVARGLLQLALLVSSFPVGARAAGRS